MINEKILTLLEAQRDECYSQLISKNVSERYQEMYDDIKQGRVFVFDNGEKEMLKDLEQLKKNKSLDQLYIDKVNSYRNLDSSTLITYFINEFERIFDKILQSGKSKEIQAAFIEYDHYYHYTSFFNCYGKQDYPFVEEPRYISSEYDYQKHILFVDEGINFQPAWLDCSDFYNLDYWEVSIETLFQLHSRVLLHKALRNLDKDNKLDFIADKPFSIYVNEHDCEVMTLYWKD